MLYLHGLSGEYTIKTTQSHSVLSPQKTKRNNSGSLHNGPVSPKRRRESVLRLTGEDGRDRVPARPEARVAESGEDGDSENMDRTIVQFTVGGDDGRRILVPISTPYLEAGDAINTQRDRESSQDSTTKTSCPSDPSESD